MRKQEEKTGPLYILSVPHSRDSFCCETRGADSHPPHQSAFRLWTSSRMSILRTTQPCCTLSSLTCPLEEIPAALFRHLYYWAAVSPEDQMILLISTRTYARMQVTLVGSASTCRYKQSPSCLTLQYSHDWTLSGQTKVPPSCSVDQVKHQAARTFGP